MINAVTLKADGSTTQFDSVTMLSLVEPSVVTLDFGPEHIARFDKVGLDLVLILKDGSQVRLDGFFDSNGVGRNEIVLVDDNEVVWWGQFDEPWRCFEFTEIEYDLLPVIVGPLGLAGFAPLLAGLLAAGAAIAAGGDAKQAGGEVKEEVNEAPVARNDIAAVVEAGVEKGGNTPSAGSPEVRGNVLRNDTDPESDDLTIAGVVVGDLQGVVGEPLAGTYGEVTLNADGSYTYVLNNSLAATQALASGDVADEVFEYTVVDENGNTSTATLTVSVTGTNDVPEISGVNAGSIDEDGVQTATGQLVVSDVDNGDTHVWTIAESTAVDYGNFGLNQDGVWTYQLDNTLPAVLALGEGEQLIDTIVVRVTDGAGGFDEQLLTVTITGSNDAPVIDCANSDLSGSVTETSDLDPTENVTTLTVNGTILFADADGGIPEISIAPIGDAADFFGEITLQPAMDGSIGWTFAVDDSVLDNLPAGALLTQEYLVTVTDAHGASATETVLISLVGRNDAPETLDDASLIVAGDTAVLDVLLNDTDADNGETAQLSVTEIDGQPISFGNPATLSDGSGTVSIDASGVLSFEPAPGFTGRVTVPYTIDDASGTGNATASGDWVINVVNAVISDNATPTDPDGTDGVLSSVDDLENTVISGQAPAGTTVTGLTITDGTNTITVPAEDLVINPDGTYAIPVDVSGLLDGTLSVEVTISDQNGNIATPTDQIEKDSQTNVSIDPITVVDGAVPTIKGTGNPGETINLTIDGVGDVEFVVGADGTWSYTPDAPLATSEITVVATATDAFGNTATDTRNIAGAVPQDQQPNAVQQITVSEAGLPNGSDPTSGVDQVVAILNIGSTDGDLTQVTIGGLTFTADQLLDLEATPVDPISTVYGTMTITGYDPETGEITYSYQLNDDTQDHKNPVGTPSEKDLLLETIAISVVDADGDIRLTTLVVAVADDLPLVDLNDAATVVLVASDTDLDGNPQQDFSVLFDVTAGADGIDDTVYDLQILNDGVASGATDSTTGDAINLYLENGVVVGRVGPADGSVAFTVNIDPFTGVVILDQQRPIAHPAGTTTDLVSLATNAISVGVTITDEDGDIITRSTPVGDRIGFADDRPIAVSDVAVTVVEGAGPVGSEPAGGVNLLSNDTVGSDRGAVHQVSYVDDAGVTQTVELSGGTTGALDTQYGTLTVLSDGNWTFTPDASAPHMNGAPLDAGFSYTVQDGDGDISGFASQPITVTDTVPVAVDDVNNIAAGSTGPAVGNVITGAGTDTPSADGGQVTSVTGAGAVTVVAAAGDTVVQGLYGALTIAADGSYSYTRDPNTPGGVDDVFDYTLTDDDGDAVDAQLTVSLGDSGVSITGLMDDSALSDVVVDEADLAVGTTPAGTDEMASGSFTVTSFDGIDDLVITAGPNSIALVAGGVAATTPLVLTSALGSTLTITGFDPATGVVDYTYALVAGETHGAGAVDLLDMFDISLTDLDGNTVSDVLNVRIIDDAPVITAGASGLAIQASDDDLGVNPDANLASLFVLDHGADGAASNPNATVYSLETIAGTDSGIIDTATGLPVVLFAENGVLVGRVGDQNGPAAFTVSVDPATGVVTLDQILPVQHPVAGSADVVSVLDAAVVLRVTAEDADGDTATQTADIGARLSFADDVPVTTLAVDPGFAVPVLATQDADTLGGADTATADFGGAIVPTNDLGNDGPAATGGAVLTFAIGLTGGAASVASGLSSEGNSVTLFVDTNGVIVGSTAADLASVTAANTVFTIAGDAAGQVTVTQVQPIDHADIADNNDVATLAADLVVLTATSDVQDADGDTDQAVQTLDIGGSFSFTDDGPTVGTTPNGAVDEDGLRTAGATITTGGDIAADLSADRESAPAGVTFDAAQADLVALSLTSDGVALVYTITDGLITATVGAGGATAFTATLTQPDAANGYQPSYVYTQSLPIDHPAVGPDAITLPFAITVTDGDGDTASTTLNVTVTDTVPVAVDDVNNIAAGSTGPAVGNVITGAGTDTPSADGGQVTSVTGAGAVTVVAAAGDTVVQGLYGALTIAADGSYSYTRDPNTPGGVDDVFDYTLTDDDGDAVDAQLTVSLGDSGVSITGLMDDSALSDVVVDEADLAVGTTPAGTDEMASGSFTVTSFDGIDDLVITAGPNSIALVAGGVAATTPLVLTSALGSTLTITGFDPATGVVDYTYALVAGETHGAGAVDLLDMFDISLTDLDGNTVSDVLNVRIIDDAPVITAGASGLAIQASDDDLGVNPDANLASLFVLDHGADGAASNPNATVYSLETIAGTDSGIIDTATGLPVVLFAENGVLVGRVGDQNGPAAFTVSVDPATGVVTLDQILPVQHPVAGSADVVSVLDAAVVLRVTAEDADGDTATQTADIGARLSFADDVPVTTLAVDPGFAVPVLATQDADTLGGADTATADFGGAIVPTNDLGNDGPAATGGAVLTFAIGLTGGAASVASGLSSEGNSVTLFVDTNGVIVGSTAADLASVTAANTVFTIAGDAAGQVTVTQVQPIDHADIADNNDVATLAADLVVLTATSDVQDADGDTDQAVQTLDIGGSFSFTDDGPTVGTTPNGAVDEDGLRTAGATITTGGDIAADLSADRESAPAGVTFDAAQADLVALSLTSDGVALVYTITDGLITATVGAGGATAFTATLTQPDAANGYQPSYVYTQSLPIDHPAVGPDAITLPFAITVTDGDGDTASTTLNVTVTDDVATAVNEIAVTVVEGAAAVGSGAGGVNLLSNDTVGSDRGAVHQVSYVDDAGVTQTVELSGGTTGALDTQYGTLTVLSDGNWTFTPDASAPHMNGAPLDAGFSYTVQDGDGDISSFATQPIALTDTAPVALDDAAITLAEGAAYVSGNVVTNDAASLDAGTLVDNFTYLSVAGVETTFNFATAGTTSMTVVTPTGTLTVNSSGAWTFDPSNSFDHDAVGANLSSGSFNYVLRDDDGSLSNSASQVITVTDTDTVSTSATLVLNEQDLPSGSLMATSNPTVTQSLAIVKEQDDIADVVFNAATIAGLPALSSGGTALVYTVSADGHTLAATVGAAGPVAFTLVIDNPNDATGASQTITATLSQPIDQPGALLRNLNVSYEVQDIDSAIAGNAVFVITDDTPLTPVNDAGITIVEGGAITDNANGATNLLANDTLGADGGLVYDITYADRAGVQQTAVVPAAGLSVDTQFGALTVAQNGDWTYTPIPTADHLKPANDLALSDDFAYRTIDSDGDISGAAGTQPITVIDTVATIGTPTDAAVDEASLSNGSNPNTPALTATGTLDLTAGQDTFDTTITSLPTGLTSNGVAIEYATQPDGHSVMAYRGAGRTAADEVFSIALTNPTAANAGYTFTLIGPLDEGTDPTVDLEFGVTVIDSDNDTDTAAFNVTILDDSPPSVIDTTLAEDGSVTLNTSADATPANTVIWQNGDALTGVATSGTVVYTTANGTVTVLANGSITYEPADNFSGNEADNFVSTESFEVVTNDGGVETRTDINATVTPVSDAPTMDVDTANINTLEDTAIALGLNAPVITDDGTGTGNNALTERLGLITLTGLPEGAILQGSGTNLPFTVLTAPVTVLVSDLPTITSATGADITLTSAEYEALQVLPPLHTSENFTVTATVSSFEVDTSDNQLVSVSGAESSTSVIVDVQAVTDDAILVFNVASADTIDNVESAAYASPTEATLGILEDTTFDLKSILDASFVDVDGSEVRSITITNGTGEAINIDGNVIAANGSVTIDNLNGTNGQTGDIASFPSILIGGTANFSGDLNNIGIRINAQDFDADGFIGGATGDAGLTETDPLNLQGDPNNNAIVLNLVVAPVAGDVAVADVSGVEDTPIAFLENVTVTDPSIGTDGTEVIDAIRFAIPTGWEVTEPAGPFAAAYTYSVDAAGDATITFTSGTQAEREAVLDAFTITPPNHSSLDATISLSIDTTDTSGSASAGNASATTVLPVEIAVTPVAEEIGNAVIDTDGNATADLTMNGDFVYDPSVITGTEDEWFALNQGGFDFQTPWNNEDADENTFARIVPEITVGDVGDAIGSQFRWYDGVSLQTATYVGTGIDVPIAFLSTVEFLPSPDFAGQVQFRVTTFTQDFDDDTEGAGTPSEAETGEAVISGLVIVPVADTLTLTLTARVNAIEDTLVPLMIRPSSQDKSEMFDIVLEDLPAGTRIFNNGTEIFVVGGSVTLPNFNRNDTLELLPPPDSNDDFPIRVLANSVDEIVVDGVTYSDGSLVAELPIQVAVRGVADSATVTVTPQTYAEADLDSGAVTIALDTLVSLELQDLDVGDPNGQSETLTMRLSGLPDGFSPTEGALLTPPSVTGTDRVWSLNTTQLDDALINVPDNFSGEVTLFVEAVTTENDGSSLTGAPVPVMFTVTPSPEAITTNSAVLVEDQISPLNFAIVHQNGDTDETISGARVRVADISTYVVGVSGGYTLYDGTTGLALDDPALGLTIVNDGTDDFYELSATQAANLSALPGLHTDAASPGSVEIFYEITDTEFGADQPSGTGNISTPVVSAYQSVIFTMTATPVTDAPDAFITAITSTDLAAVITDAIVADDAAPDTVVLDQPSEITVTLNVTSPDDDGSEHIVRVLITDVPIGVTVDGAQIVGPTSWLIVLDGTNAIDLSPNGGLPVTFIVSDQVSGVNLPATINMEVQVQDRGDQAAPGTSVLSDTVSWVLDHNFPAGGPAEPPADILDWSYNGMGATEDAPFQLSDVLTGTVDATAATSNTLTIQLTDLPAGTIVDGMTQTVIDGVLTWTASTQASSTDAQTALEALLTSITITLPADSNDNNNAVTITDPPGPLIPGFQLNATLIASVIGGAGVEEETISPVIPVLPEVDPAVIDITLGDAGVVLETDAAIPITIDITNDADGAAGSIVGGNLYVQVDVTNPAAATGTLTSADGLTTYTLETVSGIAGIPPGQYYVVPNIVYDTPVDLIFTPDTTGFGSITVNALIENVETGDPDRFVSSNSATTPIDVDNNGAIITTLPSTGTEVPDNMSTSVVELLGLTIALNDNDGSENFVSILLGNVPDGFLVTSGPTAATATAAVVSSNAGGANGLNTWVLAGEGEELPAFIAIQPPANWSGTISNLQLLVTTGETALGEKRTDILTLAPVTVTPVANGIVLVPTATFGDENAIVPFNFNASITDTLDASIPIVAPDEHQETATINLTGLGANASIYIGSTQLTDNVTYDAGADTYMVTGLSQGDIDDLGFLQAPNAFTDQDGAAAGVQLGVTAFTVDASDPPGTFDVSATVSSTITLNVSPQLATNNDDTLLWNGLALDALDGEDTIEIRNGEDLTGADLAASLSNVETLDLGIAGANLLDLLTPEQVQSITDDDNILSILGAADDTVNLSGNWQQDAVTGLYTGVVGTGPGATTITLDIDDDVVVFEI